MRTFTELERNAARRLIDLGAFTIASGDFARDSYLTFVKRGWVDAGMYKDGRWLVKLTPLGRSKTARGIMGNIAT